MASRANVGSNDPTLLYLKGIHKETMQALPKRSKSPAHNDILTKQDYEQATTSMYTEIIGLFNNLKNDLKNDDSKDQRIEFLEKKCDYLEKQLVKTHLELEKSQQYQNRDTLKICGIKEPVHQGSNPPREDTDALVTKFFEKADIPVPKEELSITHRVPSRDSGRCKALLVKLRSRNVRNSVMRKKKDIRENTLLKEDFPDAFIVEHLTPMRAKVAYRLRQDTTNIEKVWTIDGRIKVILRGASSTDKPITVDSLSQLTKIPGWTNDDVTKLVFEA